MTMSDLGVVEGAADAHDDAWWLARYDEMEAKYVAEHVRVGVLEGALRDVDAALFAFFGEYAPAIAHPTSSDFEELRTAVYRVRAVLAGGEATHKPNCDCLICDPDCEPDLPANGEGSTNYLPNSEKHDSSTKGGTMAEESLDLNEEEATRGGEELEEVDPVVEAGREEKAKDPNTLANPTELQQGGGGDTPGTLDSGSASN